MLVLSCTLMPPPLGSVARQGCRSLVYSDGATGRLHAASKSRRTACEPCVVIIIGVAARKFSDPLAVRPVSVTVRHNPGTKPPGRRQSDARPAAGREWMRRRCEVATPGGGVHRT